MTDVGVLNDEELELLLANIDKLDADEIAEMDRMVEELARRRHVQNLRDDLIAFCRHMQPDYKVGRHHRIIARELMDLECGSGGRLCVSVPPRHGKSQLASIYYPAWFLGRNPGKKVMTVSHTADLAVDFGRKVRNLIDTPEYRQVFPNVTLSADSKSAGRWDTNFGGTFYATGVGSSLAGRGADLLIIDDAHSEQDILNGNFQVFERAYDWFRFGARTRLMPGGRVAIISTRWHMDDLIGRLIRDMTQDPDSDQYNIVEFPAIIEVQTQDPLTGVPVTEQKPLWPEFFDLPALLRTKASMPTYQWNAQYQQSPTSEEAALVKREWWKIWKKEKPPAVEYVIMSLDAAAESHNRADFTSLTTWGVFHDDETNTKAIILLNAVKKRVEFPELKDMCMAEYKHWEPDAFIVEKKSSGTALFQEFRRAGLVVQEYTPHRGSGDKTARLNSVADIIRSGRVWVPETRWAEDLVEEIAGFPFAANDDQVDSCVMALMRFRNGGFITLDTDEPYDELPYRRVTEGYY